MTHYRKNPALRLSSGQALNPYRDMGFSLVEVLVTIVILLIGLLGLAGLQGRALTAQMEAYQRSQALILVKDMADRINANRANASAYVTTGLATPYLGTDNLAVTDCTAVAIGQPRDFCEWNNALQGAAEVQSGGAKVGAMIGARGCVYQIAAGAVGVPGEYLIAVAWQGMNSTTAPDATTAVSAGKCGYGLYNNEALHRVIALPISIADL